MTAIKKHRGPALFGLRLRLAARDNPEHWPTYDNKYEDSKGSEYWTPDAKWTERLRVQGPAPANKKAGDPVYVVLRKVAADATTTREFQTGFNVLLRFKNEKDVTNLAKGVPLARWKDMGLSKPADFPTEHWGDLTEGTMKRVEDAVLTDNGVGIDWDRDFKVWGGEPTFDEEAFAEELEDLIDLAEQDEDMREVAPASPVTLPEAATPQTSSGARKRKPPEQEAAQDDRVSDSDPGDRKPAGGKDKSTKLLAPTAVTPDPRPAVQGTESLASMLRDFGKLTKLKTKGKRESGHLHLWNGLQFNFIRTGDSVIISSELIFDKEDTEAIFTTAFGLKITAVRKAIKAAKGSVDVAAYGKLKLSWERDEDGDYEIDPVTVNIRHLPDLFKALNECDILYDDAPERDDQTSDTTVGDENDIDLLGGVPIFEDDDEGDEGVDDFDVDDTPPATGKKGKQFEVNEAEKYSLDVWEELLTDAGFDVREDGPLADSSDAGVGYVHETLNLESILKYRSKDLGPVGGFDCKLAKSSRSGRSLHVFVKEVPEPTAESLALALKDIGATKLPGKAETQAAEDAAAVAKPVPYATIMIFDKENFLVVEAPENFAAAKAAGGVWHSKFWLKEYPSRPRAEYWLDRIKGLEVEIVNEEQVHNFIKGKGKKPRLTNQLIAMRRNLQRNADVPSVAVHVVDWEGDGALVVSANEISFKGKQSIATGLRKMKFIEEDAYWWFPLPTVSALKKTLTALKAAGMTLTPEGAETLAERYSDIYSGKLPVKFATTAKK